MQLCRGSPQSLPCKEVLEWGWRYSLGTSAKHVPWLESAVQKKENLYH